MIKNMKIQLFGVGLALVAGVTFLSTVNGQGATPKKDGVTTPKRLGGKRLAGIKVKPRSAPKPAPVTGPRPAPVINANGAPSRPAITAPAGMGAISFEAGSQTVDFGKMIQGETRETIFHMESTGADPLVIASVGKSCGCTKAEVVLIDEVGAEQRYQVGTPIPTGTKFAIKAAIDTTGKSHAFKSDITLTTNDPRRGVVFSLLAEVEIPVTLSPRALNLGMMKATESKSGQTVVTSSAFGPFVLTLDPNIPLNKSIVDLIPTNPDANGKSDHWTVKVTAGPNLPEGSYHQSLRLVTDLAMPNKTMPDGSPQFYDAILFTTATVQGPVTLSTPHVSFGLVRPGEALTRKTVIHITDTDFVLSEAPAFTLKGYGSELANPELYEVSITAVEGTKDWEVNITMLGMEVLEGNGSFRGIVQVNLGHPAKELLDIGFAGVVRKGATKK